jgi:hypothetical protein
MNQVGALLPTSDRYTKLRRALQGCLDQATEGGKGDIRHAGKGTRFEDQDSMLIRRLLGPGAPLGQTLKKYTEAHRFLCAGDPVAARAELRGAVNYLGLEIVAIEAEFKLEP